MAKDLCDILELQNPADALNRLDDDEKDTLILNEGNRGNPSQAVVSEPGMYQLVLGN